MTILEFEAWVSDNYEELVKVARTAAGSQIGQDMLHDMIEAFCEGRAKLPPWPVEKLTPGWVMRNLKDDRINADDKARRRAKATEKLTASLEVLGSDTFTDTAARRSHHKKKIGAPSSGCLVEWEGRMPGNIRWRFQQMKDAKLFDGLAIHSLADSIRGVSHRSHCVNGQGVPFGIYGKETFGEQKNPVSPGVPWTHISCGTGRKHATGYRKHGGMWGVEVSLSPGLSREVTLDQEQRDNNSPYEVHA